MIAEENFYGFSSFFFIWVRPHNDSPNREGLQFLIFKEVDTRDGGSIARETMYFPERRGDLIGNL